ILGALTIIIFPYTTPIFIAVIAIVTSLVQLRKAFKRYHPGIIFSKEVVGVNIHEHEFVVTNRRPTFSARIVMPKRDTSSFTGGRTRTKGTTSAIVYLKLDDGNVTFVDKLTNAQTDIYEIGDRLYRFAGTRCPVILNKEVEAMPCPICGTQNKHTEPKCITCGLSIEDGIKSDI
ncbi:MAG: hypothetical protein IKV16_04555, partial [Clostridia bacterium]|nr:hypothetical protein [Clostridia bacterium]